MERDPARLAQAVLRGESRLPRVKPARLELARGLPLYVEELLCGQDPVSLSEASRALENLWKSLQPRELADPAFGTSYLVAGCLEAASLLGLELAPIEGFQHRPDFQERQWVARPRVYVPLMNDAPVRVYQTPHRDGAPADDPDVREVAVLVSQLLGIPAPRWGLERAAPGRSKMAALFLRVLLEQWPQGMEAFKGWGREPVTLGCTGELDAEGVVHAVDGLEDKLQRFFHQHPDGTLFIPASQWKGARSVMDALSNDAMLTRGDRALARRFLRRRLLPLRSALELMIRLGVRTDAAPATRLFEKLRKSYERVTLWNNDVVDLSWTLRPDYARVDSRHPEALARLTEGEVLEALYEEWLDGNTRTLFVEGGPGSGKSIALQRLAARGDPEHLLLGPAFMVTVRDLVRVELDLARALAMGSRSELTSDECHQLVALAHSPALRGSVWLLVDGLDEADASTRQRIRELVDKWPGPTIIGARPLPNELSNQPHLRVSPLDASHQEWLFERLGKPGHWRALVGGDTPDSFQSDRRRLMISDLCSTPLGVSILAQFDEAELGPSLNVQRVLRGGVTVLLERAQKAGRISLEVFLRMRTLGLPALGKVAWAMIRKGSATLTLEDLEELGGDAPLADDVLKVVNNSDLVQRVGLMSYQFSHKSLAELCAAHHLRGRPDAERELLGRMDEPGAEAVAFHFGALVEPERLARFLQSLAVNPKSPLSSLALATRLLGAVGPGPLLAPVALDILLRRVRVASWLGDASGNLPGRLGDNEELWRALAQWAEALRPHARALIDACPPAVGQFLDGRLPPLGHHRLPAPPPWEDLHSVCDFAERLILTLGLEQQLPLAAVVRFRKGAELLQQRPPGPWVSELEPLFDMDKDGGSRGAPAEVAAAVWAVRAPPEHKLRRLDLLSKFPFHVVKPLIDLVSSRGTRDQRREALIRFALARLEFNEAEHPEHWRIRRYARMSREQLLRRWELLWRRGFLHGNAGPLNSDELNPLYKTFLEEAFGPARWRALVAWGFPTDATLTLLRDEFPAVRVEAMVQLNTFGPLSNVAAPVGALEEMLQSADDDERWMAALLRGWDRSRSLEALLQFLTRRSSREDTSSPSSAPWLMATRSHGEQARAELLHEEGKAYLRHEEGRRAFLALLDTDLGPVAEELGGLLSEGDVPPGLLVNGSPRQRRVAAQALKDRAEELAPYVDDADPEIAKLARNAVARNDMRKRTATMKAALDRMMTGDHPRRQVVTARPPLRPEQLATFDTFDALWTVLPAHELPFSQNPLPQPSWDVLQQVWEHREVAQFFGEPSKSVRLVTAYAHHPVTRRLEALYAPKHNALLMEGLKHKALAPFAVTLLRAHLPIPELLPLVSSDGPEGDKALLALEGTPQGTEAAALLRAAVLQGIAEKKDWRMLLHRLLALDGLPGIVPLLSPESPGLLRYEALNLIHEKWEEGVGESGIRPEALAWARRMEHSPEPKLQELALKVLHSSGESEDAERWRPILFRDDSPEALLVAAIRLVTRFARGEDLERLLPLTHHGRAVAEEAVMALARAGDEKVLDSLMALLESPPANLAGPSRPPWLHAIGEAVLQRGTGPQALRLARYAAHDTFLGREAARRPRLPEHLLFVVGWLGSLDSRDENDRAYDAIERRVGQFIQHVGEPVAHRLILEAAFWPAPVDVLESPLRRGAEELIQRVDERNMDILVNALREHPEDRLAYRWLAGMPKSEEALDAVWRERGVPWWPHSRPGP